MKNIFKFLSVFFAMFIFTGCSNPLASYTLNQSAKKYIEKNEIDNAISRLESALELDSSNYDSHFLLTEMYMAKNNCEKALEHILFISEMKKKEPRLQWYKGKIYSCIAQNIYNRELTVQNQLDPNIRDFVYNQKIANKYIHNLTKANEAYDKYFDLAPTAEDRDVILQKIKNNKENIANIKSKNKIRVINDN